MTLITKALTEKLLANGRAQRAAMDKGDDALDFKPVVKLFAPDAQCTWLLTELDSDDVSFGLCGTQHKPNYAELRVMGSIRR